MLLCQISDLHVMSGRALAYGVVDTAACLERCVQRIVGLNPMPDLVVATGDLVDTPDPTAYGLLREILAKLPLPVYLMPGNHDGRQALRAAFPDHRYLSREGEFLQYAVDEYPVRLLALDTVIPGRPEGTLCAQRLHWLQQRLDESDAPTVIALHHPPFSRASPTWIRWGWTTRPLWHRSCAAIRRFSASCAVICIGRSRRCSPGPWPRCARARRTRCCSI